MILLNQAGVLNNWAFAGCMGHGKYCISVMRKSINMHDVLMHSVKRNISIANTQFPVNSCTSSRTRLHNAMKLCSRAPQISPTKIKSAWWYLCSEKRHSALRGNNIIWSLSQILTHRLSKYKTRKNALRSCCKLVNYCSWQVAFLYFKVHTQHISCKTNKQSSYYESQKTKILAL